MQVKTVQHGRASAGEKQSHGRNGVRPETLRPRAGEKPRGHVASRSLSRELWPTRTTPSVSPDLSKVHRAAPVGGELGRAGPAHARQLRGFTGAASKQKWLEAHGGSHWAPFYTDYGVKLQKRFFDHFLKGLDNGWDRAAARATPGAASGREVRAAPRERMARSRRTQWTPLSTSAWTA